MVDAGHPSKRVHSQRSLAFASATVCHCMLLGASSPAPQWNDMVDHVARAGTRLRWVAANGATRTSRKQDEYWPPLRLGECPPARCYQEVAAKQLACEHLRRHGVEATPSSFSRTAISPAVGSVPFDSAVNCTVVLRFVRNLVLPTLALNEIIIRPVSGVIAQDHAGGLGHEQAKQSGAGGHFHCAR